ncbi:uncharacterized protein LOC127862979 [Dreissena polymorpha]|uniref:Uncharacterized protein n=1 Tax=Dreissena polymorpha TaxID=45954 RepID=A0A9D4BKR3_DREPO|nr:uncharacterized protein LOC127862979 [Dreissena polymorpha]KAH3698454.1 hypothetical protein DPMN_085975 [Dreissena polymorpha]
MSGKTLEELAEAVAKLDRYYLMKLSFDKPPQFLLDLLTAAMLLIGEENPTWATIKHNLPRTDGRGLMDLVVEYDPTDVSAATKAKARDLLSKYTLEHMRSPFTATVFEWAMAAVNA